ncbi:MAG: FAD-binding protein [Methanomassiliicoccales archaeon]
MKILVLSKQIPDVNRIEFDASTKRIRRNEVTLQTNPFDRRAVEAALQLKEREGGSAEVATMGPPQAKAVLVEALRMGCDQAYLISDQSYAGADTLITSSVLASFAKTGNYDIVLCGKYSLDGETSQVPGEIAAMLGFSFKSSVSAIGELTNGRLSVEQEHENGFYSFLVPIPAVLSVGEKINRPRAPSLTIDEEKRINVLTEKQIMSGAVGSASPTVVESLERVESGRQVQFLQPGEEAYALIASLMKKKRENSEKVTLPPPADVEIWGVATAEDETPSEISSKLALISRQTRMKVVMLGTPDPEKINGLHCHEYVRIEAEGNERIASAITTLANSRHPAFIVFPSNTDGREIASLIAGKMKLGLTADCIDISMEDRQLVQFKPAFGGGVVARIISKTIPAMATVRPGIFRSIPGHEVGELSRVGDTQPPRVVMEGFRPRPAEYMPLQHAAIIVGIGRGLKKREDVGRVIDFARAIGAAVGGTRPIVDYGFLPRQQQIGLTGISVSPALYIALGISGQDNHVVGIRYAEKVLAVNTNRSAPIFRYADYGLVMDMYQFMEEFASFIREGRKEAGQ